MSNDTDGEDEPTTMMALAFGGASAFEAVNQNRAIERSARTTMQQNNARARAEKEEKARAFNRYMSTLRAANAEQGTGTRPVATAGSAAAVSTFTDIDTIERNRVNANRAVAAQANARFASPLVEGILGGLQGLILGDLLFGGAAAPAASGNTALSSAEHMTTQGVSGNLNLTSHMQPLDSGLFIP